MNIAVRYYSRSGNTKALAEAIAAEAGAQALSVEKSSAAIAEPVDILFIGGALYAYGIDDQLKEYLKTLKKETVKKAVVFSTSWFSKHAVTLIKKDLSEAGIPVADEFFYVRGKPGEDKRREAAAFARKFL